MDSDYLRWGRNDSFKPSWNERTKLLAGLIPEDTNTILEFGCGVGYLRACIPDTIEYTGSDMVKRDDDTVVMDLNVTPYKDYHDAHYDVVLMSGVIEYINQKKVPVFVDYINEICDTVIVSYSDLAHDKRQSKIEGWRNWYRQDQMQKIFTDRGFVLENTLRWKNQSLYKFKKVKTTLRQSINKILS